MWLIPLEGKRGFDLLWKEGIVEIENFSHRHIQAWVKGFGQENGWELTGFYG